MIGALWIITVCIIVFVLAAFLTMIVALFVPPGAANQQNCPTGFTGADQLGGKGKKETKDTKETQDRELQPLSCFALRQVLTGITGFSGLTGPDTGCAFFVVCYTGPTGSLGGHPATGMTGAQGSTGPRGYDILNNAYGVLDDAKVAAIEAGGIDFRYIVTEDNRSNFHVPPALSGDMTRHMIFWNATTDVWQDDGQFQGYPGDTGLTGSVGPTGPQGPGGALLVGNTGPTGPTGFSGASGTNAPMQAGSRFGDAFSLPYPDNFLSSQMTILSPGNMFLTGDVSWDSVTIPVGTTVLTQGYQIKARYRFVHNGIIDNSGQDGLDADDGPPTVYKGGTGGSMGTLMGGGIGGYSYQQGAVAGGPSPNALGNSALFLGGQGGGSVTPNDAATNITAMNSITNPVTGLELFTIPLSGGSGGGCPSYNADSINKAGAGGGAGVITVIAEQMEGNGVIRAAGGSSGVNTSGGPPSGGGGGGVILLSCLTNLSSYTLDVTGGTCFDSTQPGGLNPTFNGLPGFASFM